MKTTRSYIIEYARDCSAMIRRARESGRPELFIANVTNKLGVLWDHGCHSDRLDHLEKELCRRCFVTLTGMLHKSEVQS